MSDNSQPTPHSAKQKLYQALARTPGLGPIEELIREKFASESKLLREIPDYLLENGGKRMRPLLSLMSARALGLNSPSTELIEVAAGIELIHMATLLHDDIIDKSQLRRHKASPLSKFGLGSTLLTGDFLLVRAFSLCAHLDPFIITATEKACIELVEGEIEETPLYEKRHDLNSSLNIARKKTAALFRLAAECGAFLAQDKSEVVAALASYGENLGIAFQILDDILDVTSSEDLLGKAAGTDIRERKPSAINVLWLDTQSSLAQRLLTPPSEDESDFVEEALNELRASTVVSRARDLALQFTAKAEQALNNTASLASKLDPAGLEDLGTLLEFTVERLS